MDYGCRYEPNELTPSEQQPNAAVVEKVRKLRALHNTAPTMLVEMKEAAAWFSTIARSSNDDAIKQIAREQFDRLRAVIRCAEAA